MTLQNLNIEELEDLLMEETKRFTSSLHDGTPQNEKNMIRARIDRIVQIIEERQGRSKSSPEASRR